MGKQPFSSPQTNIANPSPIRLKEMLLKCCFFNPAHFSSFVVERLKFKRLSCCSVAEGRKTILKHWSQDKLASETFLLFTWSATIAYRVSDEAAVVSMTG